LLSCKGCARGDKWVKEIWGVAAMNGGTPLRYPRHRSGLESMQGMRDGPQGKSLERGQ
jgi:hypothetical protein